MIEGICLTIVHPTPVGVNDDLSVDRGARTAGAVGPCQRRMVLSSVSANLLGLDRSQEAQERDSVHDGWIFRG